MMRAARLFGSACTTATSVRAGPVEHVVVVGLHAELRWGRRHGVQHVAVGTAHPNLLDNMLEVIVASAVQVALLGGRLIAGEVRARDVAAQSTVAPAVEIDTDE